LIKATAVITLRNDDSKIAFNNTGFDAPTSYPGYTLAWGDEFNTNTLDASSWAIESGDGCPALCGWGNNELQYYLAPPNNLFFQDGKMIIEAKSESYGGKNYTSSRIKTQGKRSFKYGRIDIRALLPKGKGLWPALWMLPQDNIFGGWPRSGEIDIMELVGSEPAKASATVHYGPGPGSIFINRNFTLPASTFNDAFHVFSMEWQQDVMKFYVDNNLYSTVTKADVGSNNYPFNENFYFLINLAVGGNLPGSPDATTVFPQWFIIDYIRVYQQ
jgi:beta-glucanase (GH16 family)